MSLFRRIVNARVAQTPVEDRLALERDNKPLVKDVNLKQIASLTGRNYGSVYNTYNGLVEALEEMTHHKSAPTKKTVQRTLQQSPVVFCPTRTAL